MNDSNKEEILEQDKLVEQRKRVMGDKAVVLLVLLLTFFGMVIFGLSISVFNGTIPSKDNVINNIIALGRHDDDDDRDEGKIEFSYYEKPGVGNGVMLKDQFPTPDAVGKAFTGDNYIFEFKLRLNEKSAGVRYTIVAEKLVNSDLRNELVKLYLESSGKAVSNVVREDGSIKNFTEYANYKKNISQVVLYTGTITREEARRGYKDFTFKMWLSDELPMLEDDYGRTFLTRINVHASGKY